MAGYIGPAPVPQATQTREVFTLSSTQTTVGTGGYTPGFVDVYLNGAKLAPADFTATNGSDIVLASGGAANDILEVVAFQEFTIADQTFSGDITFTGANYNLVWDASDNALEFADNAKAVFGTGSDLTIYHDGSRSIIQDNGTGNLRIQANNLELNNADNSENYIFAAVDGAVTLYHNNSERVATTSYGAEVTASDAGVAKVRLRRTDVSNSDVDLRTGDGSNGKDFTIHVNQSERFRIDDTGDIILSGTSTADETNKSFNLQMRSHDTNEENFNVIQLEAESTFNQISIGGGTSALNCATAIRFLTGNIDTTTGTERMRIRSTGDVGIGTGGDFTYDDITGSGFGFAIGSSSASSAGIQIRTGTSGVGRIYFGDNSGSDAGRKKGSIEFDHSTDDLTIVAEDDLRLYGGEDVVMRGSTYSFENAAGNTNYAVIDSSGNVGINSSPSAKLDVVTNDNVYVAEFTQSNTSNGDGVFISVGSTASSEYALTVRSDAGNTSVLAAKADGKVGVGVFTPQRHLHVNGGNESVKLQITNTTTGSSSDGDGFQVGIATDGTANLEQRENAGMVFSTNNSPRMTIDSSGNVGIGTTATTAYSGQTHVFIGGNGNIYGETSPAAGNSLSFSQNAFIDTDGSWEYISTDAASNMYMYDGQVGFRYAASGTAGNDITWSTSMLIDASGQVGIGRTNFSALDVHGHSFTAGTNGFAFNVRTGTDNSANLYIARANDERAISFYRNDGSLREVGKIELATSSTTYTTSSDYRLKENVVDLTNATSRLKQLKPKRFNFIIDADTTIDGFLAHEVSSIVPEAVVGEKDAVKEDGSINPQGIDPSKLVPLLVKTIQELEARITALEAGS